MAKKRNGVLAAMMTWTALLVCVILQAAYVYARHVPDRYTLGQGDGEERTNDDDKKNKSSQHHFSRDANVAGKDKPVAIHTVGQARDEKSKTQEGHLRKSPPIAMNRPLPRGNGDRDVWGSDVDENGNNNMNIFTHNANEMKMKMKIPNRDSLEEHDNDNAGRFIVKFANGTSLDHARRLQQNGDQIGTVITTIEKDHIQVMKLTPEEIEDWNRQEIVQYVEADRKIYLMQKSYFSDDYPGEEIPYGINLVRALNVSDAYVSNRKMCIIDSGYLLNHPDLPDVSVVTGAIDDPNSPWDIDYCGHGTHVAGTIAALGKNNLGVVGVVRSGTMPLHIVRVFASGVDGCGWSWASTLIAAVEECVDAGSNIVNLSLGGPSSTRFEEEVYDRLLRDDNILVVAAAGNDGGNSYFYPASYPSVMSVAAVDENKNRAGTEYNYNDRVDIAAPGKGILSTLPWGTGFGSFTGTSMAAPHVAGVAALIWSHFPFLSAANIRSVLEDTAEDIGSNGKDDYFGDGLVDALAAYNYLEKIATAPPVPSASPSISAMPTTCGNGFCDIMDVTPQETCSSCPSDCSIPQHCNGVGNLADLEGLFKSRSWLGVAFKVKALKDVSFYEVIIRAKSARGDSINVKLYTRQGDFSVYEGMEQWTLVFDGQVAMPSDIKVSIPIEDPLKTGKDTERSFYVTFPVGDTILFENYNQEYGISLENNDVQLYRGEAQDGDFGSGIYNYVSFSGLLMYTNDFDYSPHPSPAPSFTESDFPTLDPSSRPSGGPSQLPSSRPSENPSIRPSSNPAGGQNEDLSSWDGWKFIKPNTDPQICSTGIAAVNCTSDSHENDELLWMHDDKGRLSKKNDQNLCLTYKVENVAYEPDFQDCRVGTDSQVWIRTSSGHLLNKATNKVLAQRNCRLQSSNLILLDIYDVLEKRCDLWSVIGPNEHDPDNFGSIYFNQLASLSPDDSTDYLFASSVSIDNYGELVAIGGSTLVTDTAYAGTVAIYKRSGDKWAMKADYQLDKHKSEVRPKFEVTVSGNGKRVAIAVASTNDSGAIQVLEYDGSALIELGSLIEGRSSGELSGIKLAIDEEGDALVIGEQYYDEGDMENVGRVRIFNFDPNQIDYNMSGIFVGGKKDDRLGSAVSINSRGDLIAYGAAGIDSKGRDSGSAVVVKLIQNAWSYLGLTISGDDENDEAGYSVKIVDFDNKIRLAVGSIYNDGNNQVNSGHVRVFECNFSSCQKWTQVGSDIDGDHGVVIDGDSFHVGDAFGFSLDMSGNGDRLLIGAPFHSDSRASDYYSGNVKLYAFDSDRWTQLGPDISGKSSKENSGFSVGLSKDGMNLLVGSPGLGPGEQEGSAQIYVQQKVSNSPSKAPATAVPTSTKPSLSTAPSTNPSAFPTLSGNPSAAPTSFSGRRFQIKSNYERLNKIVADGAWCVEADKDAPFSKLNMRPCDGSERQMWFQDEDGKIRLKGGEFAIHYQGKKLELREFDLAKPFKINGNENSISTIKSGNKNFYIGIDPSKLFSRLRLYKEGDDNKSLYSWHIEFVGVKTSTQKFLLE